jgi:hypothetical protein
VNLLATSPPHLANKFEVLEHSFWAEGDEGVRYRVHIWRTYMIHRPVSGPFQAVKGSARMALADGSRINPGRNDGTFLIADEGDRIIRHVAARRAVV